MATDYDAPRRDEVDLGEDSLEELKARRVDSQSGAVDVDEAEVAENFELPGADLADEELTVKVLPMQSDEFRCTPDGRLRVYRTTDGGDSWQALENGLPQENAWLTVLRDALAADTLEPTGLYLGTRTGDVFATPDGEEWQELARHLPPVLCVKTAVLR